ncbi:MAG: acyltransferase [Pirellulaceae bacterium]|nr:acyltransferase [Pirellulaceae bacterium]
MNSQSPPDNASVKSLDALTGLRFFAAFGVFIYHAFVHLFQSSDFWIVAGAGVSFFFVLSGFILTYVYDQRLTKSNVGMFYVSRIARIWPLHVFLLLVVLAFQYESKFQHYPDFTLKFLGNLFLIQSWVPIESWPMDFNGVAWSISTELGFYCVFPTLLLMGRRRFLVAYAAVIVSTVVGLVLINPTAPIQERLVYMMVYCHPFFRLWEFATGILAAHVFSQGYHQRLERLPRIVHGVFELVALTCLVGMVALNLNPGVFSQYPGWISKTATVSNWLSFGAWSAKGAGIAPGAVLVIWVFAWSRGPLAYLVSRPLIVYLGEISYSFYMVHYIVLNRMHPLDWYSPILFVFATLIISLGLSSLLYTFIEVPYRNGIVAVVRRDWRKLRDTIWAIPGQFWRHGIGVAAVLAIVSGFLMLKSDFGRPALSQRDAPRKQLGYSVANRGIVFRNEARLLQCDVEYRRNGSLHIRMLWETLPGATRHRFVHIFDDNENVIRQGRGENIKFRQARPYTIVLDEITLRPDQLEGGSKVGIGFFADKTNAAYVESGPRSMHNYRLDVFDINAETVIDLTDAFQ